MLDIVFKRTEMPPVPNRYFCIQLAFVQIPIYFNQSNLPSFLCFCPHRDGTRGQSHSSVVHVSEKHAFYCWLFVCNVFSAFCKPSSQKLAIAFTTFPRKTVHAKRKAHWDASSAVQALALFKGWGEVRPENRTRLDHIVQCRRNYINHCYHDGGFETWMDITLAYLLNCSAGFPCNVCIKKPYPPIILPKGYIYWGFK